MKYTETLETGHYEYLIVKNNQMKALFIHNVVINSPQISVLSLGIRPGMAI